MGELLTNANDLGGKMKQITKKEVMISLGEFVLGHGLYTTNSPKAAYLAARQTWLNREKDDD